MNNTDKSELEKKTCLNVDCPERNGGECSAGAEEPTIEWLIDQICPHSPLLDFNKQRLVALITQQCKDAVDAYHTEITDNEKKVWLYRSDLEEQCNQARKEGKQIGTFMAGSAILTEFSPLMIHRLETNFPSMTAEVIGNTYDEIQKQMKPFMDKRKAELQAQAKETETKL